MAVFFCTASSKIIEETTKRWGGSRQPQPSHFFLWKLSIIYRGSFKSFQEIKKPIHNNKLGLPLVDSLSCGLD